jgi:hypothetical protein
MDETLAARLWRAEATLALKALMHRYSNLCDRGFAPAAIAGLFVDDGVWDGGEAVGRYEGKPAIAAFLEGLAKVVAWSGHFVVNDEIVLDGNTASGFWRCIAVVNNPGETVDKWYFQDYHFSCRHEDGAWRFATIRTDLRKATAYAPALSGQTPVTRA